MIKQIKFLYNGNKIAIPPQLNVPFDKICKDFENRAYDIIKGKKLIYYYNGDELNKQLTIQQLSNSTNEVFIQVEDFLEKPQNQRQMPQIQNNNNNKIKQPFPNPDHSFKCDIHNEPYSLYCKTCKKNICTFCEQSHNSHELISYENFKYKKNDLENKLKTFKISIEKFKEDIEKIKDVLQNVINYCDNLYKTSNEIINSFDMKKRNYEILNNLKEFYNNDIPNKLDNIINSKNYVQKITQIFKIFNNINNNKLNIDEQPEDAKKVLKEDGVNMKNTTDKEKELMEELLKKNSEIERLNSILPFKVNPGEKLMTVIFASLDQKIHYSFISKNTEKFNNLESRLYDTYPEFSESENYFLCNGRKIARFKDLDYNNIKNSDIITLHSQE